MRLLFLFLFSHFYYFEVKAASCCVSNTSVSNLMILPSKWQHTLTMSQSRVIGDVNEKGTSTFRSKNSKEVLKLARLDLAYSWTFRYQTGISVKYQNKSREFYGSKSSNSGWSDIGLSQAYRPKFFDRFWIFQTINIPTANSIYDSESQYAVDAHGSGTYISSLGFFGISNIKEWDFIYSSEVHRSFARTFNDDSSKREVGGFWGASVTIGCGYIPWRSKSRLGLALTPRYEGEKNNYTDGIDQKSSESLVWDSSANFTYTINAENAVGINYTDQTLMGPAQNTLLSRTINLQYQARWH